MNEKVNKDMKKSQEIKSDKDMKEVKKGKEANGFSEETKIKNVSEKDLIIERDPLDVKKAEAKSQFNRLIILITIIALFLGGIWFLTKKEGGVEKKSDSFSSEVIEKNFATPIEHSETIGAHIRKLRDEISRYKEMNETLNKKLTANSALFMIINLRKFKNNVETPGSASALD